jgi:hypothetical protein
MLAEVGRPRLRHGVRRGDAGAASVQVELVRALLHLPPLDALLKHYRFGGGLRLPDGLQTLLAVLIIQRQQFPVVVKVHALLCVLLRGQRLTAPATPKTLGRQNGLPLL